MKKTTYLLGAIILGLTSCQSTPKTSDQDVINMTAYAGHYVSDGYEQRNEGYDWVGVSIDASSDSTAQISIRSRADQKKPTCTFDAEAKLIGKDSLESIYEGKSILYLFKNDSLIIKGRDQEAENQLYYFCSGGATVAGTYVKINGDLDQTQIDKTVFKASFGYDQLMFFTDQKEGKLTIRPVGLTKDNREVVRELKEDVKSAEIGDIDGDNSPELFFYVKSVNNGLTVVGYSTNNGKSLSEVSLTPIAENDTILNGYRGEDKYAMVENNLIRRFPIFEKEDNNFKKTGKMRQIQYKLKRGEACKILEIDKVIEF